MVSVSRFNVKILLPVVAIILAGCSSPARIPEQPEPVLMPEASPYSEREDAQGALLNEAWQALSEGRLDDADIWLGRAIRVNPTNPEIYYHMALLRQQQGQTGQAGSWQVGRRALVLLRSFSASSNILFFLL